MVPHCFFIFVLVSPFCFTEIWNFPSPDRGPPKITTQDCWVGPGVRCISYLLYPTIPQKVGQIEQWLPTPPPSSSSEKIHCRVFETWGNSPPGQPAKLNEQPGCEVTGGPMIPQFSPEDFPMVPKPNNPASPVKTKNKPPPPRFNKTTLSLLLSGFFHTQDQLHN